MHRFAHLSLMGLMAFLGTARGEVPPSAVIPFVDKETAAVVHLDLAKLDIATTGRRLIALDAARTQVDRMLDGIARWTAAVKKAGGTEVAFILQMGARPRRPAVVVSLTAGADRAKLERVLTRQELGKDLMSWPAAAVIHGVLVAADPDELERWRGADPKTPPPPWLAETMREDGPGDVRIALAPTTELRRILERQSPTLPPMFGGGPVTAITRGLKWASLRITLEPKATLRLTARAMDLESVQDLEQLVAATKKSFSEQPSMPELARFIAFIARIEVKADRERLTTAVDLEEAARLLRPAFERQQAVMKRMQCVNNLKQIMLAMHNYHSANNTFPPAFRANKAGKPLLSWRVLILPYLDQQELYNEFHLDEPWHSPHNKALIARMPDVYKCLDADLPAGRTRYLTPRGETTLFPGAEGIGIQQVTDGTSNTIAVVEAGAGDTVVWTVPNDWEVVAAEIKPETILRSHPGGSNVGFADGSVRFLKGTITPQVFGALLTRAGGEVIAADAF